MAYSPLAAGELRTYVRFETKTLVPNGQGGFTETWTPFGAAWSKKIPLRGDEVTRDNMQRSVSTARFIIRPMAGLTNKHRLVEDATGKIWNIRNTDDPYGRADRLEIDCESGVAG